MEFVEDTGSFCEDDHIGLGWGKVVSDLNCCIFEGFGFCFKFGQLFSCAYSEECLSIIVSDVLPTTPILGCFCCRAVCINMGPLVFWVLGIDILQRQ